MGVFFQERGALGKAHAERGSKAGGEPPQSIPSESFLLVHRVALRPPYLCTPANHCPPSFSFLKKDPHGSPLRHFHKAKVLRLAKKPLDSLRPTGLFLRKTFSIRKGEKQWLI